MKKVYRLENLDCAHCADKVETAIAKLAGVTKVQISFLTQKLTLETDCDDQTAIVEEAKKICKKVEPDCRLLG